MKRLLGCAGLLVALVVGACVGDSPESSGAGQSSSSSSSGGGSSSSSGGSGSSSSSGAPSDGGASSSSGGDAGDATPACTAPLPATIDPNGSECGALPLPATAPIIPLDVGAAAAFQGGTITPGQYVLVRVETNGPGGTNSSNHVYVFDAAGGYTSHAADNTDALGDVNFPTRGTFTTSGSILTAHRSCPTADDITYSYSVNVQGCDVFLELGKNNFHWTYQLRREP